MDGHKLETTGNFLSCQPANSYFLPERLTFYNGGMDVVRKFLDDRLKELGIGYAEASRRLNRNETYIQQFLKKASPRELPERERIMLAEMLKVPEEKLRGPSMPLPKRTYTKHYGSRESFIDPATHPPHNERGAPKIIAGSDLYGAIDLPIYSSAQSGDGILSISARAVDWVTRPSVLLRVQDGYGMIVAGDTMEPAIRAGETALINPHLPPRPGDRCLFRSEAIAEGSARGVVREFRGETEGGWKVRQLNPAKDFTLKKTDWPIVHRIVGNYYA